MNTYVSTIAEPSAVALVIHGLNVKPEKMDDLCHFLEGLGVLCYRITLRGHGSFNPNMGPVSRQAWLEDSYQGYREARAHADTLGVPLYGVGFSLGGLMTADIICHLPKVRYDKLIFFAPSIAIRSYANAAKALLFLKDDFVAHSLAPPEYRAHNGMPVSAYRALFDSIAMVNKAPLKKLNIPTLVFIHPLDELVSDSGTKKLCRDHKLCKWEIVELPEIKSTLGRRYFHLILSEAAVGAVSWKIITEKIRCFIA